MWTFQTFSIEWFIMKYKMEIGITNEYNYQYMPTITISKIQSILKYTILNYLTLQFEPKTREQFGYLILMPSPSASSKFVLSVLKFLGILKFLGYTQNILGVLK